MGGGAAVPEGGGGRGRAKRPLDAVINVVPAIDLLSCTLTFLLITAVWTQISRLQVQTGGTGAPPSETELKQIQAVVTVGEKGITFTTSTGTSVEIPALGKDADGRPRQDVKALVERLKALKSEAPDQSSLTVAADDGVPYGELIQIIDAAVGAGLPAVSVTAAG